MTLSIAPGFSQLFCDAYGVVPRLSSILSSHHNSYEVYDFILISGVVPRMYGHTMTLHRDSLHVIGPRGYYKYSVSTRTWAAVPADLPREILSGFHSAVQDEGLLYLVGGYGSTSPGLRQLNGVRSRTLLSITVRVFIVSCA